MAIVLAGCSIGRVGFSLQNDTSARVNVYQHFERMAPVYVASIDPGEAVFVDTVITRAEECTVGVLIAENEAGEDVAEYRLPLCNGQAWTITP